MYRSGTGSLVVDDGVALGLFIRGQFLLNRIHVGLARQRLNHRLHLVQPLRVHSMVSVSLRACEKGRRAGRASGAWNLVVCVSVGEIGLGARVQLEDAVAVRELLLDSGVFSLLRPECGSRHELVGLEGRRGALLRAAAAVEGRLPAFELAALADIAQRVPTRRDIQSHCHGIVAALRASRNRFVHLFPAHLLLRGGGEKGGEEEEEKTK